MESREDIPRVSVGSIHDWQRIATRYKQAALSHVEKALAAEALDAEHDATLAHLNQFIEATFAMAQPNLRVNGHNFEEINADHDMEAFDEVLDRRIWSLADTRLQWHKRMATTRRQVPREIETRLSELMTNAHGQDQTVAEIIDALDDQDELLDDEPDNLVTTDLLEDFQKTSAMTEELRQTVPDQQERVQRAERATGQLTSLKY